MSKINAVVADGMVTCEVLEMCARAICISQWRPLDLNIIQLDRMYRREEFRYLRDALAVLEAIGLSPTEMAEEMGNQE